MTSDDIHHVLYHYPYSICSIMVRYSFACRGEQGDASKRIELDERETNLLNGEQLTEHFLCDVNGNGEVPVLVLPNGVPMPESVDITLYMGEHYPSLLPQEHKAEIEKRLKQLHDISFFALTFTGKPQAPQKNKQLLNDQLKEEISPRYRKAIEGKIQRIDKNKMSVLNDEKEKLHIERARTMLQDVERMLNESDTDWCLGLKQPSALDAHLVVFIARMQDVNRGELIPERVKQYGEKAMSSEAWKKTMEGRRTMP